ncbi:MAG: extracellular solute-binding protein [Lachnospiraceae bacterium]|nr:extracellular solute-binding protein [Lachnospiraceae bacterium]
MKKKLLALLMATSMVATLAACGGDNGGENAGSGETVALTVWAAEEDQELTSALVEKFKAANPDQTFDITIGVQSEATAKDTILVDVEAAADVFAFANDQIQSLVDAGALQPVQDVDTVTKNNVAGSVSAATINNTLYAYPFSADNGYFLYYNSSLLSEEDVQSYDNLLAAAEKLNKKVGHVLNSGWWLGGFYHAAGFHTTRTAEGGTDLNWNGTADYTGVEVTQGILDIVASPAFVAINDGETGNNIASGEFVAFVTGTWDAGTCQAAFGDGYAATKLPTFTVAGKQVQEGTIGGYKMMGVNAYSDNVGWAMELALFLTNEESQVTRFEQRQIGPSNIKAAESDAVKANIAIAAIAMQNQWATLQTAGDNFWAPSKTFGEILAKGNPDGTDLQTLLDTMVKDASAAPQ